MGQTAPSLPFPVAACCVPGTVRGAKDQQWLGPARPYLPHHMV